MQVLLGQILISLFDSLSDLLKATVHVVDIGCRSIHFLDLLFQLIARWQVHFILGDFGRSLTAFFFGLFCLDLHRFDCGLCGFVFFLVAAEIIPDA